MPRMAHRYHRDQAQGKQWNRGGFQTAGQGSQDHEVPETNEALTRTHAQGGQTHASTYVKGWVCGRGINACVGETVWWAGEGRQDTWSLPSPHFDSPGSFACLPGPHSSHL